MKISLFSGEEFNYESPSGLCIEDIAHALSHICRFGGHYNVFYSVAEHCIRVSKKAPKELKLLALLHDCAEAITGDIPRPMKPIVNIIGKTVDEYELLVTLFTFNRLKIQYSTCAWEEVMELDRDVLEEELLEWRWKTTAIMPAQAERLFLLEYETLLRGL